MPENTPVAETPANLIQGIRVDVQYYCKRETDEGLARAIFHTSYMIKEDGRGMSAEIIVKVRDALHEMAIAKMGEGVEAMNDREVMEYDEMLAAEQESLRHRAKKGGYDA